MSKETEALAELVTANIAGNNPSNAGTSLKVRNRIQGMTGAEKSAVILMALGENMAPVWEKLGEDEIREISHAMSGLGVVEAELVESLISDFVSKMTNQGNIMGSYEQTQKPVSYTHLTLPKISSV